MVNLGINIDPFLDLIKFFDSPLPAMNKLMATLELQRIGTISASLQQGKKGLPAPLIDFVNKVTEKTLNVYVTMEPEIVQSAIQLQPEMITLTGGYAGTEFLQPVDIDTFGTEIREIVNDLSAHDVVAAICVAPQVGSLKQIHRTGFDFIELSALDYSAAENYNEEIEQLHRLREIANMANNLGMGVNIRGDLGLDNLGELKNIEVLDTITLAKRFFQHAVFKGFDKAIADFYDSLMK